MTRRCALYRIFNSRSELLYVGVTEDPRKRLTGHKSMADWYVEFAYASFEWFTGPDLAYASEAAAIEKERPRYNVAPGRGGLACKGSYKATPASIAFARWAEATGASKWAISSALGVRPMVFLQVVAARRPPSEAMAVEIERLTEGAVPASAWKSPV